MKQKYKNKHMQLHILSAQTTVMDRISSSYHYNFYMNNNYFLFTSFGHFYDSDLFSFDQYIKSGFQIKYPNFHRYTPFIKIEHIYIVFGNKLALNPISTNLFESSIPPVEFYNELNVSFGFKLSDFIVSYHLMNLIEDAGAISNNFVKMPMHKYLNVTWQFEN